MRSSNQTEAAPLNPPRQKPPNAVINFLNQIDNFNVGGRLVQIYGIYERQYKTSEILGITFYKFIYLIMTTLTLDLHINPRLLYLTDYNSFNMIIASFFGRKLALNIPKYEEKEGIQEEYEEVDLLLECDYPLHTSLVICYVSHTMRNAFIREGSGLEFQLRKYEELKKYHEEIACDIVNTLYYQDEQGRRKMLTALQSTYNHPICAGQKFGTVIETMAVAFKAEAMKFLTQKPCLFLMDFRHLPRKYLRYGFPLLKIKLWIHAVFRLVYILMFAYMLCRSPIYSDYENDRSHASIKARNWIEVVPSFYVLSVLSTQFFVNVYEVSKMLWNSIKMRERNNWFHTFGASLKRFYGCKRLSVWRTILLIFLLNLEAVRFVLSLVSRKNVQTTAYTGIWVLVPVLLELLYYLLFMITTLSSLRFLSSFKSLGFFSLFIRKMFKTVSMFVFIFCAFWFVLAVTHVGLTRSYTATENTFLYTITSIGKFEIFGNVDELGSTGNLPDCSNYTRTIHYILSMDHDEASCLFRSTLLPFLVFAYIFVSAVLLVNLLTAQLSKEYDEEYENCSYYNGYLKYDELSKIEAKLLFPPPLSIIYALLHVLLFILRLVFKLLKHMQIGGWCDPCYQFLRKNTIKRMKGDPYQVVKVWREKPEYRIDAIVKNDIKHILTVRAKSQKANTTSSQKKLFVTRSRRIFLIRKRKE